MDRRELGEEEDKEEDARQLQETIAKELKISKGREEKRQRFVQFIRLTAAEF